jgi:pSer/pThr/pTyr-binding forkhead associated (FHA) protein
MEGYRLRAVEFEQTCPLKNGINTIGRNQLCDVVIPFPSVSRVHCIIYTSSDECRIKDFNSRNGIYINGTKVEQDIDLRLFTGDVIRMSGFNYVFEVVNG